MDSAERLFATKGFNGTSMNDIVKSSGFSKGAIYSHFESKERLFLSLWERQTAVGIGLLKQRFSPDDTAVEKLLKVAEMTISSSCGWKRYETIHSFIVEIFEEGVENGEFKECIDIESLTSILFAALDGLGFHYATLGIEFDAKRIKDTLIKVVLEGVLS